MQSAGDFAMYAGSPALPFHFLRPKRVGPMTTSIGGRFASSHFSMDGQIWTRTFLCPLRRAAFPFLNRLKSFMILCLPSHA